METLRMAKPLQSSATARRLILVDIENFNGLPVQSSKQAEWCKAMLTNWLDIKEGEIVVVAVDGSGILAVNAAWTRVRLCMGKGEDGADLVLIEEIERMNPGRFTEIALVSGDGIFAESVARAAALGLPTKVYTHRSQLSKRLQLAATEVHLSQDFFVNNGAVAADATAVEDNVIQLYPHIKETA